MYVVAWTDAALDGLADVWVTSPPQEREAVSDTVREIDRRLSADPQTVGESREQGRRVAFFGPLAIRFAITSAGRVVVTSAWRNGPRPRN